MKHNVNEETLMAYLYGECNAEEKIAIEKFFLENPGELKKYEGLLFVKDALGKAIDKEVIAPPIFMHDEKPTISLWKSGFVRYATGIAAAVVMIMFGAKLLGVQMNYRGNEFTLSFGQPTIREVNQGLSPEQVQDMIDHAMNKNNDFVKASWEQSQNKMNDAIKQNSILTSNKINEINRTASIETQNQIRQFMQGLQAENSQAMQDYIRLSSSDQKQYIESLLVDFSKYMQEQRNQDLNLLNARLNTLEEDNTVFREEAGQILTSLVSNNNSSVKRN